MSKSWTWIAPYSFAILAVLLAGPLLSNMAVAQSVTVPYLALSGPHVIRLGADLLALTILWLLAFAASQQIPDNGCGPSFTRTFVLLLTPLPVTIFATNHFASAGLHLSDP